jgi:hypothetical protein
MNYTEKNLTVLLLNHPYLKDTFSVKPDDRLTILGTPSGFPSATYNGFYIHSRHNPPAEAKKLIEGETQKGLSSAVFFGFGLGYLVEAFIGSYPEIPAIVIEPDPGFFLKALDSRNMDRIFNSGNIRFFFSENPEEIIWLLDETPLSNIQVIKLRSVYEKNAEYYKSIERTIENYLAKKEVNINTLRRFGKRWVKNLVLNIRRLIAMPGINSIADSFRGFPGLVIASGPSLDGVLPCLGELAKRMVIISVDTSLSICLKQGIEPDFLVIVDPQYWNTRHTDWAHSRKPFLVTESSTHPRIFRTLDLKGFFSSSFFPLGRYFESIIGEKGKIGAGGSVATAAWDIARLLGLGPIYMAGLDLGYPLKKTHYKGAFFEQTFHTVSSKLRSSETSELNYLLDAAPFYTQANDGNTVLTDKRMCIYKWWFETQMKLYNTAKTFNLSEHGVRIEGMELTDSSSILTLPIIRDRIERVLAENIGEAASSDESVIREKTERVREAIGQLADELATLKNISETGLHYIDRIKKHLHGGRIPVDALTELDSIDKKIQDSSSRIIAGFLLQPIIQSIFHSAPQNQDAVGVLETTEKLYHELFESASFHHEALNRALTEL